MPLRSTQTLCRNRYHCQGRPVSLWSSLRSHTHTVASSTDCFIAQRLKIEVLMSLRGRGIGRLVTATLAPSALLSGHFDVGAVIILGNGSNVFDGWLFAELEFLAERS